MYVRQCQTPRQEERASVETDVGLAAYLCILHTHTQMPIMKTRAASGVSTKKHPETILRQHVFSSTHKQEAKAI